MRLLEQILYSFTEFRIPTPSYLVDCVFVLLCLFQLRNERVLIINYKPHHCYVLSDKAVNSNGASGYRKQMNWVIISLHKYEEVHSNAQMKTVYIVVREKNPAFVTNVLTEEASTETTTCHEYTWGFDNMVYGF